MVYLIEPMYCFHYVRVVPLKLLIRLAINNNTDIFTYVGNNCNEMHHLHSTIYNVVLLTEIYCNVVLLDE